MAVRSTVLGRFVTAVAGTSVLYTVPSSTVAIAKSVQIWNQSGVSAAVFVWWADSGGVYNGYLAADAALANGSLSSTLTWVAAVAGDILTIQCNQAGVHFWISGAALPF